jgi:GMP synthase (glutamine-hydrolysing)
MTQIAVVQHLERPFTGHAGAPLRSHAATLIEIDRRAGDPLPPLDDIDGVVSFGGEQSVLDVERDPVLREEVEWLRDAVAGGVPVLGVCLGGQLLAHALGGSVFRLARGNLAWKPLQATEEGADDAILGGFDRPAGLFWNDDAIVPPPDAVELLRAPGEGCAAFRHGGSAWGIQFHPEVTADVLAEWWKHWGSEQLAHSETDEAAARAADSEHIDGQAALSAAIFGRFAALVALRRRAESRPLP